MLFIVAVLIGMVSFIASLVFALLQVWMKQRRQFVYAWAVTLAVCFLAGVVLNRLDDGDLPIIRILLVIPFFGAVIGYFISPLKKGDGN